MPLRKLCFASMVLASCSQALAGAALSVSPTNLTIRPGAQGSTVTVRNMSDSPTNVQAQVFEMRQEQGAERLLPAARVAVSPPFAKLQPRQDYVFRVIRLGSDPVSQLEAYRLVVRDIPNATPGSGVAVSVGHSIPVFFAADGARAAKLEWRAALSKGAWVVQAANVGQTQARVSSLALSDGRASVTFDKPGWILPGASMAWSRPAPKGIGAGPWRLTGEVDGGPIDVRVDADR